MTDLEWLLTHSRCPYHRGRIEGASLTGQITSRTCSDQVSLQVILDGPIIHAVWHQAKGCLVNQAASSYLCEWCEGSDVSKVRGVSEREYIAELGTLTPLRQQCALQSFRCLMQILTDRQLD